MGKTLSCLIGSGVSKLILEHPAKVTLIAIQILEPRMNEHWAVGDIKIREVRLFGKFWKVEV
jgi:hypothetical protein